MPEMPPIQLDEDIAAALDLMGVKPGEIARFAACLDICDDLDAAEKTALSAEKPA